MKMDWKSAKIVLASTATMAIGSQLVKNIYKYFTSKRILQDESYKEAKKKDMSIALKNREINDVLLFTSSSIPQIVNDKNKSKNIRIWGSREINCYKLIKYIKSTRETLDVCMYLLTSSEIAEQIVRLGQRHVIVRILVDYDMAFTPPSQIKRLQEYSFIQVQTSNKSMIMHHKFCIIDGPLSIKRKNKLIAYAEELNVHAKDTCEKREDIKNKHSSAIVMAGSLNWSTQAMFSNHESVIVTSNPSIVQKFEKEFESLWPENESVLLQTPR